MNKQPRRMLARGFFLLPSSLYVPVSCSIQSCRVELGFWEPAPAGAGSQTAAKRSFILGRSTPCGSRILGGFSVRNPNSRWGHEPVFTRKGQRRVYYF